MPLPDQFWLQLEDPGITEITAGASNSSATDWVSQGVQGRDGGIFLDSDGAEEIQLDFDTPTGDAWFSICWDKSTSSGFVGDPAFIVFAGPTTDLLRCKRVGSSNANWIMQYWDGAAWQDAGTDTSTGTPNSTAGKRYDIRFNLANSGGEFSLYLNGDTTPLFTFTGDTLTTADTTFNSVRLRAHTTSSNTGSYAGNMMLDSSDTRDLWIYEDPPISNGSLQEWPSGTESNIDDLWPNSSMSETIRTDNSGQRDTYNMSSINADLTGKTIEGVVVGGYGRASGTNPLFIEAIMRTSGGTVYESSQDAVQYSSSNIERYYWRYDDDPDTSLPWASDTDVEAYQCGFISKLTS